MKKLLLLLLIVILYIILSKIIFVKKDEKISIKLKNEIAILLIDNNVLIKSKNSDNLIVLNNDYNLSKIKTNNFGVIVLKDDSVNIKYKNKYLLTENKTIDGINYNVNNNIIDIKYNNTTFCIFNNIGSVINDTRECNFIYLYNISNVDNLDIDDNVEIIFINSNINIPTHLLEDIYGKDIDVYTLDINKITVIRIGNNDYNTFVIPKR